MQQTRNMRAASRRGEHHYGKMKKANLPLLKGRLITRIIQRWTWMTFIR